MEKPKVPQKSPFVMEIKAGTYAWCSCGASSNQPYCDGSHVGTGFAPHIEEVPEDKTVAWCGCKHTNGVPYCDGSHAKMEG